MLLYKRLRLILLFVHANEKSRIPQANELAIKFLENYTMFFELMLTSSKLEEVEYAARKCLQQQKSVVICLRRTCQDVFDRFRKEKCFKGLPFSSAMYVLLPNMS